MHLKGLYDFLRTTCFAIDRFDGPSLQVARVASSLQAYSPQEIRTYFKRRYYPRTSIHRVVQNYLSATGIPSLTLQLCGFLDFSSAVALITTDAGTASSRGDIFLYADFFYTIF